MTKENFKEVFLLIGEFIKAHPWPVSVIAAFVAGLVLGKLT